MAYIQIGFLRKTHGVRGEIKAVVEEPFEEFFFRCERVFLEIKGIKQPFFLKSVRGGGELIVAFENVDHREAAFPLQHKPILLPQEEVPEELLEVFQQPGPHEHLVGYALVDQHSGRAAAIQAIRQMPQQDLAVVLYRGKEVLIPLIPAFIRSIDDEQKRLVMDLPEGLWEL
jgi:16S rRNA processing protein RimM